VAGGYDQADLVLEEAPVVQPVALAALAGDAHVRLTGQQPVDHLRRRPDSHGNLNLGIQLAIASQQPRRDVVAG